MSGTIKIIAAAVDENNLTMYKADGSRITIPQGDPRIKPLVEKVIPALDRKEDVYLSQDDLSLVNHYQEAEQALGGFTRFVRVLKTKFKEVVAKFTKVEPTNGIIGHIPVPDDHPTIVQDLAETDNTKSAPPSKAMDAVNEIMKHAAPASAPEFHTPDPAKATTIVAVMEDGTMIEGIEQMDVQFRALVGKVGSVTGMTNFLKRLSTVKHSHSIQDLLKFMEKGELPIAEDGSVLVYKRLRSTGTPGVFVDCHSGKVKQRVGSYVCMDAKMVDANRHADCSNGLHIARRDYLTAFSGDICVLCKLAPEDVIAVPHGDARKLRARAYHIIALLTQADHDLVTRNKPMGDTVLLGNAIAGNHIGIIEKVEITKQYGGGLIITPVEAGTTAVELNQELYGESLDHLPEDVRQEPTKVDAKSLAKTVGMPPVADVVLVQGEPVLVKGAPGGYADGDAYRQPAEPEARLVSAVVPNSKRRPVDILVQNFVDASTPDAKTAAAIALVDYKKSAKKTWSALGVPAAVFDDATNRVKKHNEPETEAPAPAFVAPAEPAKKAKKPSSKISAKPPTAPVKSPAKSKPAAKATSDGQKGKRKDVKLPAVATAVIAAAKPSTVLKGAKPVKRTKKEEAAHLLDLYNKNPDLMNARALVTLKQEAKKSWTVLGVDEKLGKKLEARVKP